MIILTCVEMDLVQYVLTTRKYDWKTEPMGKSRLIVDTPPRAITSMRKICNYKARSTNFRYDLIVYLIHVLLLINAHGLISSIYDRGMDTIFPQVRH